MKTNKSISIFVLFILSLSIVIAVPPFLTQSSTGSGEIQIEYPKISTFRDTNTTLNFHVYNSTGFLLTNKTTDCYFHLYNDTGNHVLNAIGKMYFDNVYDYEVKIGDDLMTYGQEYSYIVQCNNTQESGFISANIFISNLNSPITDGYWLLMLIPFLFGLVCLFGAATLGEDHTVLKIFLFLLSLICSFAVSWIGSLILYQDNANFAEMFDALGLFTKVSGLVLFAILIYFLMYLFYKMTQAANQEKEAKLEY